MVQHFSLAVLHEKSGSCRALGWGDASGGGAGTPRVAPALWRPWLHATTIFYFLPLTVYGHNQSAPFSRRPEEEALPPPLLLQQQ